MTDRQDRLHELCAQVKSETDPDQLHNGITEINNILGSIISEVGRTMRSLNRRVEKKHFVSVGT
jgi:hypothetical protein